MLQSTEKLKGWFLLDTGPLYLLLAAKTKAGLKMLPDCQLRALKEVFGDPLAGLEEALDGIRLPLKTVWPVLTEALYYVAREARELRDPGARSQLYARVKAALEDVGEEYVGFREALANWGPIVGDIADASVIAAPSGSGGLAALLTCDAVLAEYARRRGLRALTLSELFSLLPPRRRRG